MAEAAKDSSLRFPVCDWSTAVTMAITGSSFIAGILVGRKLNTVVRKISSLVVVGPTKLALVVREDLKMGKGKIASQCSHGTLMAYHKITRISPQVLQAWEDIGQPKVVLRATDLQHINLLTELCVTKGVPVSLVCDAGRTQVAEGTPTVLAVGPAQSNLVDRITGTLKLL